MTTPFPPPDYIPAPSAIEGIEIYMPAPVAEPEHRPVVDFRCPRCGGERAYSVENGGLTCTACGYHEAPPQPIVGKGAQEFEFHVETIQQAAHGWGVARKELQCDNCGAVTIVPPDSLTATCPFCHSKRVVQRKAPQDMLRPRFLLPFEVDPRECQPTAREWLGSSWMSPRTLESLASINTFTPIFIPFWTFDAHTRANWKAEVGHTRTTGTGKNRRTKTVWKWESGRVQLEHDDVLIVGTTHLSPLLLNQIKGFRLEKLVPYDPAYLAGSQAQAYDTPLPVAWEQARHQMRENTKAACKAQASSNKIRNFSMGLDFSDESWRYILVPIYLAAYRFEDQVYQIMINGQTKTICGQRPVSWWKISAAVGLLLLPGLMLGLMSMLGQMPGIVALLVLGAGLFAAFMIIAQAIQMDDI